ncbi:Acetyl esterase/lipase [Sporobacter termitidis DSM 10068]|uniref:Acetyl esterase/lipase n=1 Tax=Sporobacter termitidis DSM 10068 TaxID=1123282 RepID=A0A1M5US86_9FIRM|nr:alpha/beta hydrolase [Sporobacter termitidis]SHH65859.1 Acetyl esterase/lipase [Sporobacter termitidis DSM 10068]
MRKYDIHPDFRKYEHTRLSLHPMRLPLINTFLAKSTDRADTGPGVLSEKRQLAGWRNGLIDIGIYKPADAAGPLPCLIYMHGGAFALKAAPYHKALVCAYAKRTPCIVVFVDYRLAPKFPFPAGAEDCYSAYAYVLEHAEELGVDKSRIAVGGDSAGAALAAGICLMARDRNTAAPCFQLLIYPVTDARQLTESIKRYDDTPMWNSTLNKKMWKLYLRDAPDCGRGYASPIEALSLERLPGAYIEVAEFDCLRDEAVNFANALRASGVPAELMETKGTVHGFDIALDSAVVRQSVAGRIDALKKALYPPSRQGG